ncbi:hypothetical protein Back11_59620 [Paenibacillus baekrokdamisoli]|uniref:Uncharacterized protein n=1 Tax=Paenibacillus baekrokdamisoli TaxID=1712516 RepID=A0A3G9J0A3_9BACL|nr:hypothetical protein [Paenibacillus baekrokdamisoli]MBB3071346.1 hypothetical protein [Paenibacillus baekrokdamisoli]BBH24617.1 hypothetical protein Back11_59620 [Paenibacillus baekrokdamisoli]
MSRGRLKLAAVSAIIFLIMAMPHKSSAYTNSDFKIGIYWPPVAAYTNAAQYDYLQEANINWIINTPGTDLLTESISNTMLDLAQTRGMKVIASDARFNQIYTNVATDAQIDAMADSYKNHAALGGYYVMDEPFANQIPYVANANSRFLLKKPDAVNFINLLPINPTNVETEISPAIALSQTSTGLGYFVTSTSPLGQTFTLPSDCTYIDSIELNVDPYQWGSGETLTLKLWDSPSKTTLIASSTLAGSTNLYPRFSLKASVTANTSYYWELTHNGGGDNSIGWVASSSGNVYSNGTAYVNGTAVNSDFYFQVYKTSQKAPFSFMAQLETGSGYFVTSTNRLGQTFYTPAEFTFIDLIELNVDSAQWGSGETLTLTLWDSPSKSTQIASASLSATNNGNYPRFPIKAVVSPITSYYWELTHNGGGDNSVGWVTASTQNALFGDAYENGVAKNNDFYFSLYSNRYPRLLSSFDESGEQVRANSLVALTQSQTGSGSFVTSTNPLGQTFTTPSDCSYIDYIELYLDPTSWSSSEALTLILWNSPSKTTRIASYTLSESRNGQFPRFLLNTSVSPNTSYYWELSHSGGGNNSIGWVTRSSADVYAGGSAYENGAAKSYDFWFKVYKDRLSKDKSINQTSTGTGSFVTLTNKLGQTFKTPSTLDRVMQYIELNIDSTPTQWSPDEYLTLTLYNDTSKQQVLGKSTLNRSFNSDRPRFYIWADLQPNTTYYFELTHSGGGDNSVGWVSQSTANVYNDGNAYVNGIAQSSDLYFRAVFSSCYQDYLEEFVDAAGSSNLGYLTYDQYPIVYGSGINIGYYRNKELIRSMGLKKGVPTASFLQSFGIPSSFRRPVEDEMRFNVYTSLAYGNKALYWFTWWTPTGQGSTRFDNGIIDANGIPTDLFISLKNLNTEVKKLGNTLMSLTSQGVYHSGVVEAGSQSVPSSLFWQPDKGSDNVIISYFKNASNRKYIMVVNKSLDNTDNFTFRVNPKPATVTEVSKSTGLEVSTNYNVSTGMISQQLLPGEGRLYALPSSY